MCYAVFKTKQGGENSMEERILRMKALLDERQWRLYLANEAMSAGYGGVSKQWLQGENVEISASRIRESYQFRN